MPPYRPPLGLLAQTQQNPLSLRMPNPQMVQPPQMPKRPGLLERFFPVPQEYGGLLSPEAVGNARRDMILRLGAGLLSQSGWSPQRVGLGQALGNAIGQMPNWNETLAGLAQQQHGAQQMRQTQQGQANIQQIAGKYRPKPGETPAQRFERISAMTSELAGVPGTEELVGRLSNVLAQLRPTGESGTPQHKAIQTPTGPQLARYDEATNTWIPTGAAPAQVTGGVPQLRTVQGPDGRPIYEEWNPRTGEWTATGKVAFSAPSEQERRAAFFLPFMPEAETAISNFTGAPDRFSTLWQDKGFRELTSAERQELDNAATVYAEAWLRLTTGAAYNEQEFQNAYRLFAPQPGDKPATLRAKSRRRAELRATLEGTAGRARGIGGAEPVAAGTERPPMSDY